MTTLTENPYQPPLAVCDASISSVVPAQVDWKAILRRWELLRIPHNGIVGLAGLVGLAMCPSLSLLGHLDDFIKYAVMTNVLYLLGSAAELYLNWFVDAWELLFVPRSIAQFVRSRYMTMMLFVVGTLISVGLALLVAMMTAYAAGMKDFH